MKFLEHNFIETVLEYKDKIYSVSKYFVLSELANAVLVNNCRLLKLREPIIGMDEDGYLVSKSFCLEGKLMGLFRFDNIEGNIDCISFYGVDSIRLGDYFYNHTHFFYFRELRVISRIFLFLEG